MPLDHFANRAKILAELRRCGLSIHSDFAAIGYCGFSFWL